MDKAPHFLTDYKHSPPGLQHGTEKEDIFCFPSATRLDEPGKTGSLFLGDSV
jgi:hypothetical protein